MALLSLLGSIALGPEATYSLTMVHDVRAWDAGDRDLVGVPVIVFVKNLQLAQGETSSSVIVNLIANPPPFIGLYESRRSSRRYSWKETRRKPQGKLRLSFISKPSLHHTVEFWQVNLNGNPVLFQNRYRRESIQYNFTVCVVKGSFWFNQ